MRSSLLFYESRYQRFHEFTPNFSLFCYEIKNTYHIREFDESTNAIRVELNRMEKAGLLISQFESNRKYYKANPKHPLYNDIMNIVRKTVGIDQIIEKVINNIGDLKAAYVIGNFAEGIGSDTIELALTGEKLDTGYIDKLIKSAKSSIVLIDNYIDESVLTLFSKRNPDVSATIFTANISKQFKLDLKRYNAQMPSLLVTMPINWYGFRSSTVSWTQGQERNKLKQGIAPKR